MAFASNRSGAFRGRLVRRCFFPRRMAKRGPPAKGADQLRRRSSRISRWSGWASTPKWLSEPT